MERRPGDELMIGTSTGKTVVVGDERVELVHLVGCDSCSTLFDTATPGPAFKCDECGALFALVDPLAGVGGVCPDCGNSLTTVDRPLCWSCGQDEPFIVTGGQCPVCRDWVREEDLPAHVRGCQEAVTRQQAEIERHVPDPLSEISLVSSETAERRRTIDSLARIFCTELGLDYRQGKVTGLSRLWKVRGRGNVSLSRIDKDDEGRVGVEWPGSILRLQFQFISESISPDSCLDDCLDATASLPLMSFHEDLLTLIALWKTLDSKTTDQTVAALRSADKALGRQLGPLLRAWNGTGWHPAPDLIERLNET